VHKKGRKEGERKGMKEKGKKEDGNARWNKGGSEVVRIAAEGRKDEEKEQREKKEKVNGAGGSSRRKTDYSSRRETRSKRGAKQMDMKRVKKKLKIKYKLRDKRKN